MTNQIGVTRNVSVTIKNPTDALRFLAWLERTFGLAAFSYLEGKFEANLHTEWNIGRFEGEVEYYFQVNNSIIHSDLKAF